MEKIRSLNRFQKGILICMIAMILIFAVSYLKTIARVGYRYNDAILVPTQENADTLYSGSIDGQQACFRVSDQDTVVFEYGTKTYGPYTVREDPSAVPKNNEMSEGMTGIEVREGDDILFRGGILDLGHSTWLYNEDGTSNGGVGFSYMVGDGIERDANGNPIDRMKLSVATLYELVNAPKLTHDGEGYFWFVAVFICILNAVSVLFADELFRWGLAFKIRDAELAEPSDLEITGRYIGWIGVTILALVVFIMGLR